MPLTDFIPASNPFMIIGTAHTPILRWQTHVFFGASNQDYLLACFYCPRRSVFIINLLPPAGVLDHLIDGLWIETADVETTIDDVLCHFFGPEQMPTFFEHPATPTKLPYEYVRHLIAISEIGANMHFDIYVT
jgi:hypothetical protein